MNIVVSRTKGLGDAVFALEAVDAYKKQKPDTRVWFLGADDVSKYCDCIEKDDMPDGLEVIDLDGADVAAPKDRSALMADMLGVPIDGWNAMFSFPKNEEYSNCVGIHPGTPSETRRLTQPIIHALLHKIPKRKLVFSHKKLVLYDVDGSVISEREIHFREEAILAAASCESFIGMDSGPTHVAIAADIPTVAIFSHINPDHRVSEASKTKNICIVSPSGLSCGPCGDFLQTPCSGDQHALCAKSVLPEDVISAYERLTSTVEEIKPVETCDILVLTPWILHGGGGTWLNTTVLGLVDRGMRVKVISSSSQNDGSSDEIMEHFISIGLSDHTQLAKIIDQCKPQALLYQHDPALLYALEKSEWKPAKVVCVKHVIWASGTPNLYTGPLVDKWVTDFVVVSNCTGQHLERDRGNSTIPIHTIYNAPVQKDGDKVEYPAGVKSDFTIGTVSRLDKAKHLDLLVDVVGYLRQSRTAKIKGFVVGGGDEYVEDCLREKIEALGMNKYFRLVGKQLNPWPYYEHMDLFVLPTEAEGGLPLAMTEAMSLGVPCAVTKVADVQDIWTHEKNIFLIPTISTMSVLKTVMAAIKHPNLQDVGMAGKKKLDEVVSLGSMIDAYVSVLGFDYEKDVEERLRALGYID